jgi:hypothetical protein
MKRVIYVGVHNKPGKPPLCSTTRSGKLIDRIIKSLPEYEHLKSNMFDVEMTSAEFQNFPHDSFNYEWASRVDYSREHDIVVALGANICKLFTYSTIDRFIRNGHPSSPWSNVEKDNYVIKTAEKIRNYKF